MASRIELPEDFGLIKEVEPIQDDVILISLSKDEITRLFSGHDYVHDAIGQPKIIITKSPEN